MEKTVKISSKGQITLPRQAREVLGSDVLRLVLEGDELRLLPVNVNIVDAIVHVAARRAGWAVFSFDNDPGKL